MQLEFDLQRNLHTFQDLSEPHWHNVLEILVCLSDGGYFMLGDSKLPLCRGMVFIVDREVPHRCIVEVASYDRYILHIGYETLWMISSKETDVLSIFQRADGYVMLNEEQMQEIYGYFERCISKTEEFGADLSRNIALMEIILFLARLLNNKQYGIEPSVSKGFLKIMPVLNYIMDHYREDLSLELLSEKFFISKYHLCRLFKKSTGFSVGRYIINHRIRQACILLRHSSSVQESGEKVGFGNNANYIRAFKQIIGMPPGQYGKYYKNAEEKPLRQ